jgi:sRNA-binding regulator protein Hfq
MMQTTRIAAVAVVAWLAVSGAALGQSPLNPSLTLQDNLNLLQKAKKPVTVVLRNGASYRAAIGSVGDHFVVLTGPQQKEFFDVLVRIDDISALEVRARDQ